MPATLECLEVEIKTMYSVREKYIFLSVYHKYRNPGGNSIICLNIYILSANVANGCQNNRPLFYVTPVVRDRGLKHHRGYSSINCTVYYLSMTQALLLKFSVFLKQRFEPQKLQNLMIRGFLDNSG